MIFKKSEQYFKIVPGISEGGGGKFTKVEHIKLLETTLPLVNISSQTNILIVVFFLDFAEKRSWHSKQEQEESNCIARSKELTF